MIGEKFGQLTILSFEYQRRTPNGTLRKYVKCQCDCGNTCIVGIHSLRSGKTKSCGCLRHEKYALKHGKRYTRLYKTWLGIKQRCNNSNNPRYKDYGERGIKVCDEWLNDFMMFYNWSMSNGYNDTLTIDRIDVNGNYEPSNCRGATTKQQADNRRDNVYLTYNGKTQTMMEWSDELNISYNTIKQRHRKKWSDKECLFGK